MKKVSALLTAAVAFSMLGIATSQALEGTLQKIVESGEIVVSHRDATVPFSYLDNERKPVGYAVDICVKIAEKIKAELKKPELKTRMVLVNSTTRIPLLLNGTIDLECGSTTNTVERQKQVSFSPTYFVANTRIMTKKSKSYKKIEDLAGKTVVSTAGSTNLKNLNTINVEKKLGMNVTSGIDIAEAFMQLETDRAEAIVLDDIVLASSAANSKTPDAYHLIGEAISLEPYAVMIRRDDPSFKQIVEATMKQMTASGEIEALYKRWFESPIPPRDINLKLEMSPGLRKALANGLDSADPAAYQ